MVHGDGIPGHKQYAGLLSDNRRAYRRQPYGDFNPVGHLNPDRHRKTHYAALRPRNSTHESYDAFQHQPLKVVKGDVGKSSFDYKSYVGCVNDAPDLHY